MEGYFDVEGYSAIKWIRSKFVLPSGFTFGGKKDLAEGDGHAGEKVWEDRMVAEKQIMSWLGEVPGEHNALRHQLDQRLTVKIVTRHIHHYNWSKRFRQSSSGQ